MIFIKAFVASSILLNAVWAQKSPAEELRYDCGLYTQDNHYAWKVLDKKELKWNVTEWGLPTSADIHLQAPQASLKAAVSGAAYYRSSHEGKPYIIFNAGIIDKSNQSQSRLEGSEVKQFRLDTFNPTTTTHYKVECVSLQW